MIINTKTKNFFLHYNSYSSAVLIKRSSKSFLLPYLPLVSLHSPSHGQVDPPANKPGQHGQREGFLPPSTGDHDADKRGSKPFPQVVKNVENAKRGSSRRRQSNVPEAPPQKKKWVSFTPQKINFRLRRAVGGSIHSYERERQSSSSWRLSFIYLIGWLIDGLTHGVTTHKTLDYVWGRKDKH